MTAGQRSPVRDWLRRTFLGYVPKTQPTCWVCGEPCQAGDTYTCGRARCEAEIDQRADGM